jgi:hypothetical protein
MCRDLRQGVWAWDLEGNVKSYDGEVIDPASDFGTLWSDFYSEDLNLLTRVGSQVTITSA